MTGPDAVARLFGVGFLWMGVHCAGMCGPLLFGLDVAGSRAGVSVVGGALRTLLYQAGKAVSYAALGAVAGFVGGGLDVVSAKAGSVLAVVFGVAAVISVSGLWPKRAAKTVQIGRRKTTLQRAWAVVTTKTQAPLTALVTSKHPLRPFALGLVFAFLPCMIALWALSLAALTSSPLWGAAVMLSLTVATTPLLLLTSTLTRTLLRMPPRVRSMLQRLSAGIAGLWLILIGLSGAEIIPHAHLPFTVAGKSFMFMLF